MGAAIRAHLEASHEVHALLMTTGENSGARASFPNLTRDEFVAARDDEYTRAARRLGIRFSNIHIGRVSPAGGTSYRPQDGQLTSAEAQSMILDWLQTQAPGATLWVKTLSNLAAPGRHADHITCGRAAAQLQVGGQIVPNGLRFYVEPYQLAAFRTANPSKTVSPEHASSTAVVQAACDEYKAHDAVGGKYGIGDVSVHDDFVLVRADTTSYYHVP